MSDNHGRKGDKRRPGEGYEENHEKLFGAKKIERGSFVYDKESRKLVPKAEFYANKHAEEDAKRGPTIQSDIEPFVSPITQKLITSRSQLRKHNAEHGVTDTRDYSSAHFEKAHHQREAERLGQTPQAKKERIDLIQEVMRHYETRR